MPINLSLPKAVELKPRIVVIGVGGAGGNAVNNMIGAGLDGVEFVVANTDAQALALSKADRKIQMGTGITQGLGAGMRPEIGEESAEESLDEILEHIDGAHMLFVAAGMGGGTGTGAAPVIARAARERGILTVGIVTKPFMFEGSRRMNLAEQGIENLYASVDTMITIPNQNLFRVATENTTMSDAFSMADEVLHSGVRGVTDLMVVPGLINLDFNDVRTVMDEMGKAMMGTGESTGERRAVEAAESAINNPLLDDVSLKGAKGVLINITGGKDLTLYEVDEAASLIRGQVDENANIIVGSALDDNLDGIVRVSVVATGVDSQSRADVPPVSFTARPSRVEKAAVELEEMIKDKPGFDQAELIHGGSDVPRVDTATPLGVQAKASPTFEDENGPPPYIAPRPYPPKIERESVAASESPQKSMASHQVSQNTYQSRSVEKTTPNVTKPAFGFFGLRKKAAAETLSARSISAPSGDLFSDEIEDELEIPSFLRRQSR